MQRLHDIVGLWASQDIQFSIKILWFNINIPLPASLRISGAALLLQRHDGSFRIALDSNDADPCAISGQAWFEADTLHRRFDGEVIGGDDESDMNHLRTAAESGKPLEFTARITTDPEGRLIERMRIKFFRVRVVWESAYDPDPEAAFEAWLQALRKEPDAAPA